MNAPPSSSTFGPHRLRGLLWVHALVVPALIAALALALRACGWDQYLSEILFDPTRNQFPARGWLSLDLLGHRLAKSVVFALWFVLLATALAAPWVERLREHRAVLWATVLAMAAGPSLVVMLKSLNSIHCPWDLKQFGGTADMTTEWFVSAANAGRCFPGGHAAGGFSLAALYFAGTALGHTGLTRIGLALTVVTGLLFSAVRVIQGAHFVSHNLWAAAIDWWAAALIFAFLAARTSSPKATCP